MFRAVIGKGVGFTKTLFDSHYIELVEALRKGDFTSTMRLLQMGTLSVTRLRNIAQQVTGNSNVFIIAQQFPEVIRALLIAFPETGANGNIPGRAAQTNHFTTAELEKAMASMVEHDLLPSIVALLEQYNKLLTRQEYQEIFPAGSLIFSDRNNHFTGECIKSAIYILNLAYLHSRFKIIKHIHKNYKLSIKQVLIQAINDNNQNALNQILSFAKTTNLEEDLLHAAITTGNLYSLNALLNISSIALITTYDSLKDYIENVEPKNWALELARKCFKETKQVRHKAIIERLLAIPAIKFLDGAKKGDIEAVKMSLEQDGNLINNEIRIQGLKLALRQEHIVATTICSVTTFSEDNYDLFFDDLVDRYNVRHPKDHLLTIAKQIMDKFSVNLGEFFEQFIEHVNFFNSFWDKYKIELIDMLIKEDRDTLRALSERGAIYLSATDSLAIELLSIANDIDSLEQINGMTHPYDDKLVTRSHRHFIEQVEPAFKEQFNTYGETDNERIVAIECHIRALILDFIKTESNPSPEVIEFIEYNQAGLIQGDPALLEASVPYFKQVDDNGFAAWRSYNPFAPIAPYSFSNLLIPPTGPHIQEFSTAAASNGLDIVDTHTTSLLIRKRVAYYYLVIMDPNLSNEERPNYILNFISKLRDIRNANGSDSVSCFPGQIPRVAAMGFHHPIAKLPHADSELIEAFFKAHIVSHFKLVLEQCPTMQDKEAIFDAIIMLNSKNAKDHLAGKASYSEEQVLLRKAFTKSLGKAKELMEEFTMQYPASIITEEDDIYFKQYIKDPAQGRIASALTEFYRVNVIGAISLEDDCTLIPAETGTLLALSVTNPFQLRYQQLEKQIEKSPALKAQLLPMREIAYLRSKQFQAAFFEKVARLENKVLQRISLPSCSTSSSSSSSAYCDDDAITSAKRLQPEPATTLEPYISDDESSYEFKSYKKQRR